MPKFNPYQNSLLGMDTGQLANMTEKRFGPAPAGTQINPQYLNYQSYAQFLPNNQLGIGGTGRLNYNGADYGPSPYAQAPQMYIPAATGAPAPDAQGTPAPQMRDPRSFAVNQNNAGGGGIAALLNSGFFRGQGPVNAQSNFALPAQANTNYTNPQAQGPGINPWGNSMGLRALLNNR